MAPLTPRESGEFIVKNAKYLSVVPEGLNNLKDEIIAGIKDKRIDVSNFSQQQIHPKSSDAHAVEWIFVVDTLNFCFWTPTNYTKYKVNGHTGYFALCAAINRAIQEGIDITNSQVYSKITADVLRHIFRPDDEKTQVPLFEKRLECLHEVGKTLLEKWGGKFENVILASKGSAKRLLHLIVDEFPCFRDEAKYMGTHVSFYKRAQILIGDLWSLFKGEGLGAFDDITCITMFADYRIPQVLIHFGSLKYGTELLDTLKKDVVLTNGDPMEVEIRGASIYIVEQVKDAVLLELEEKYKDIPKENVNSILIDHFLWDYRRQHAEELEHIPFHKTLSIYY